MKTISYVLIFISLTLLLSCTSVKSGKTEDNAAKNVVTENQSPPDDFEVLDNILVKYVGSRGMVTIPDNLGIIEIGKEAFKGTSVQYVVIPPTIKSIGSNAFQNCKQLYSVNLPSGLIRIDNHAFFGCSKLNSIKIPETVEYIGFQAFAYTPLTEIVIPASVQNIENYAFGDCDRLSKIIVEENNKQYTALDGVLFNKDISVLVEYPPGKLDVEYSIPQSVRIINEWAFSGNEFLKVLKIPSGITSIDGNYVFSSMDLASYIVDSTNSYFCDIEGVLFSKDKKRLISYPNAKGTTYTVPENVEEIAPFAFYFRKNITDITFPESLIFIGEYSFCGCKLLTDIKIPSNVLRIEDVAFHYLNNLKVTLSRNTFHEGAFAEGTEIIYYE